MQETLQKIWKNLLETLNPPTKICRICFKEIKPKRFINFMTNRVILCEKCDSLFKPVYKKFMIKRYHATAIYYYDQTIRTYLYQFKGCFDYELYPVFLGFISKYYHLHYHGYVIIPVPSYIEDDNTRGFNHVETIFKTLNIKMMKILVKTEHHKQANSTLSQRKEISKYMKVKENVNLTGMKVLIVDDVYTTGNTMKTCIKLVEDLNPKKIEILVLSMTT